MCGNSLSIGGQDLCVVDLTWVLKNRSVHLSFCLVGKLMRMQKFVFKISIIMANFWKIY